MSRTTLLCLLSVTTLLAGCSGTSSTTSTSRPPSGDGGPITQPNDSARYGGIPSNADRVTLGNGKITYKVPHEGTIWVGNQSREYRIVTHSVRRGDEVVVNPSKDRIDVNGQPIYAENLERNDEHAIFYREAGSSGSGPSPYAGIPHDAESVATGQGAVSWRASSRGTIWVGDNKNKALIFTHRVNSDDLIEVDGKHDYIRINGKTVYSQNLESKHDLTIFFR